MRRGLLITLPQSDIVTQYLTVFSKPIINECKKRQIKYHEIKNNDVNMKNVENKIKSYDYKMNVFNGHGEISSIKGHKNRIIIDKSNSVLLKNKITYARSCWTAEGVGRICEDSSGCFIGYKIPFMFLSDITWSGNPIKDNIAKIFFDTSNRVPIGLIKGQTAKQADDNSRKSMLKMIKKLLLEKQKDSQVIAEVLWNNFSGQVLIGKSSIKL